MKLYSSTVCLGLLVVFICEPTKPVAVSEFCQVAKTIIASKSDTPETLSQVRRENAKFRRLCKNKK